MALTLGVNSYATIEEADLYFEDRIDVAAWDIADDDMKGKALVTSTRMMEGWAYAGYATSKTQNLAWPRVGGFFDTPRGRSVTFTKDYTWVELDTTSSSSFLTGLKALPAEIELVKKAVFEQAYHLINNDGVLDSTGGIPDSIRVGTIELSGLRSDSEPPRRSGLAYGIIKPVLQGGGANLWFRAN